MKILLECTNCGQECLKERGAVNRNLKLGQNNFCSKMCAIQYSRTSKLVPCECCGKLITRTPSELARNKQNFCSQTCFAKVNNTNRTSGRSKLLKRCEFCGKSLKRTANKFCSNKCLSEKQYVDFITAWKSGANDGTKGVVWKTVSDCIRRYLFEKYDSKCCRCGWSEVNPYTGSIPLEVDHIDGDSENNLEENLRLICPNCHSLTKTYRGANRGKGRNIT